MTTPAQLKTIHTLKSRAGLAEDEFRALLAKETGQASSKDLPEPVAGRFITVLRGFAPDRPGAAPSARRATGKFAPVLQALWLSGWNLGVVRNRDDAALIGFVERQTGLSHTRFLQDHADANRAIEALKAWLARDGGVAWPLDRDAETAPLARKRAVVRAIAAKLVAAGAFTPFLPGGDPWPSDFEVYGYSRGLPASFGCYAAADWDRLASHLGARLRAALAETQTTETHHG